MADILVSNSGLNFQDAYTAAATGDRLLLDAGPHVLTTSPQILKRLTIDAQERAFPVIAAASGAADAIWLRTNGSTLSDLEISNWTKTCIKTSPNIDAKLDNVSLSNSSASYAAYLAGGTDINWDGGEISTFGHAAFLTNGATIDIDGVNILYTGSGAANLIYGATGALASGITIDGCDIDGGVVQSIARLYTTTTSVASVFIVTNSRISHETTAGHSLSIGSEASNAGDGCLNGYAVTGNEITGHRGIDGDAAGICHAVFVGHNVDGIISRNKIYGGGYGVVWKGTGTDNVSGQCAFNAAINCGIGYRHKGIDAAIIAHNVALNYGVNDSCVYFTDNDGLGSANNLVHVGNLYIQLTDGTPVAKMYGVVSFATNTGNAYVCNSLNDFLINGDVSSWAEWVSATGEVESFCIVNTGDRWDVYTSESPTTIERTLTMCPVNTTSGLLTDIVGSPLTHRCPVVAGINDSAQTDAWGNATPAAPNIGADQGAAKGFGPWTPFDATMPPLSLSPDCPGKLRQVQEWKKVASAKEIERYTK